MPSLSGGRWGRRATSCAFLFAIAASAQTYTISTIAGGLLPAGAAASASIGSPQGVATDGAGNIYFTSLNCCVFRVDRNGILTLIAGSLVPGYSGDGGPAVSAQLNNPHGLAVDGAGNIYIADYFNDTVRAISANGVISTVAGCGPGCGGTNGDGGSATSAGLAYPWGLALDAHGNLFIADSFFGRIRRVSPDGVITTVAGTGVGGFSGDGGPATVAQLAFPAGLTVDAAGDIFVADSANGRIRRISPSGIITTVAGSGGVGFGGDGGPATAAVVSQPTDVRIDAAGNLYIADSGNNRIRKVSTNGIIQTVVGGGAVSPGDGSPAINAQLYSPSGLALDAAGDLLIADHSSSRIREVSPGGVIGTVAGGGTGGDGGPASLALLGQPEAVAVDPAGDVFVAETSNHRVRKISPAGIISTVAGNGIPGYSGDGGPASAAQLNGPDGLAVDALGNLYISDYFNSRVRKVTPNGLITTVAGTGVGLNSGDGGPAVKASLFSPSGLALDSTGNLYIAEYDGSLVRKVSSAGIITTVAGTGTYGYSGDGGPAIGAQLSFPNGVALDSSGNLFISDGVFNQRIRRVSTSGIITTVAGTGSLGYSGDGGPATTAQLDTPQGIAINSAGNLILADEANSRIRQVSATGAITTIAGGTYGYSGDGGPATAAGLAYPFGVAADAAGRIYFTDVSSNSVRVLTPPPLTIAGPPVLPAGTAAIPYDVVFSAGGGSAVYTWSAAGLPGGLSCSAAGVLSGTPAVAGTYNPRFTVTDSVGHSASTTLSLTIYPASSPVVSSLSPGSAAAAGPSFTITVNGSGFLSGATVDWNGAALPTTFVSATQLSASVATSLIASAGSATISVVNPGGATSPGLTPFPIAAPVVTPGGVVPISSSVPIIESGSWISIYGSNLANGTYIWNNDFPTSLGGVSVTIDNKPAYLWYVSPTQINVQAPDDTATGPVSVVVTIGSASTTSTVTLAQYGPSFSLLGDGKHVAGVIATPDGSGAYGGGTYDLVGPSGAFSFSTRPVKAGETLLLYGVGFGPTTPHVPAGQAYSGAAATAGPVSITIGGVTANVVFSGITEAGVYQFNLTVPTGAGSGDQPLQASVNGVQTPAGPVVTVQ